MPLLLGGCRFFKTQSGVKIQELALGSGLEARSGDSVEFEYVLRCALLTHRRQTSRITAVKSCEFLQAQRVAQCPTTAPAVW